MIQHMDSRCDVDTCVCGVKSKPKVFSYNGDREEIDRKIRRALDEHFYGYQGPYDQRGEPERL